MGPLSARFVVVLALLATIPGPSRLALAAGAGTDAVDPATRSARQHFAEGVKLYDARPPDFDAALSQFRQAYEAKPSAGIKRNIALCLKALRRYPEAMDALDEVLAEGGDTLTPDVKEGLHETLAELDPLVGSVKITVIVHANDPNLHPPFELLLDDEGVATERLVADRIAEGGVVAQRLKRSLHLLPGAHRLQARALGFQEATRALTVEAGAHDVPLTLDLFATTLAGLGRLTVRVDPATADVGVDGVVLAKGTWSGELGVGSHAVTASAQGFAPFATSVTTLAHEARVLPIRLVREPVPGHDAPDAVQRTGNKKRPAVRNNYVSLAMTVQSEALTPTPAGFGDTTNTKRSFGGLTFTARYGRKLGRGLALDLFGEAGGMTTTYGGNRISLTNWVVGPELVFHTTGIVRFLAGAAAGVEGQLTNASVAPTALPGAPAAANVEISGHGVGPMGLVEGGVEGGPWPLFFQATVFGELHGIGAKDGAGNPLYVETSTIRGGLRLAVGCEL